MDPITTDAAIRGLGRSALRSDPAALGRFNADVTEEFRANGGRVGGPFAGADIVLLTTTGRRSGRPRTTPLEYFRLGARVVVGGSYGGAAQDPGWVRNLRADTHAHVEIGTESSDVIARELVGDERDALFAELVDRAPRFEEYQSRTARVIPLFELHPDPEHSTSRRRRG